MEQTHFFLCAQCDRMETRVESCRRGFFETPKLDPVFSETSICLISVRGLISWQMTQVALAIFDNLHTPPAELIYNKRPGLVGSGPPVSQGPDKPRRSICDNQARNRS